MHLTFNKQLAMGLHARQVSHISVQTPIVNESSTTNGSLSTGISMGHIIECLVEYEQK